MKENREAIIFKIWVIAFIVCTFIFSTAIGILLQSCEQTTDWEGLMNTTCEVCGAEYSSLAFSYCPYHSVCANCGNWYDNLENYACPYCGSREIIDR
jgi:Zn finger protein HypA/HybF involved in hydrogenase expression